MGLWPFTSRKSILVSGLLCGASDRHSHILYGVDDGVRTLDESLQCISLYEHAGLKELWLTPHIMEDVPNSSAMLRERFAQLCDAYVSETDSFDGKVRLRLAAEYMMDTEFSRRLSEGDILTMENNAVLVEMSTWAPPTDMMGILSKACACGYRPILAHPERYHYMHTADYEKLHAMGIAMQLNFGSLLGVYGEHSKKRAHELLKRAYYSFAGSDCHRMKFLEKACSAPTLKESELKALAPLLQAH